MSAEKPCERCVFVPTPDGACICRDMRQPGEAFCAECPDHEACASGWPCGEVRRVNGN